MLYFWKAQGPRTSKLIFPTVKYTNTQIQLMTKCQEYQTYALFLNSCWFKDVKNDIPQCPKLTSDFCIVPQGFFFCYFCDTLLLSFFSESYFWFGLRLLRIVTFRKLLLWFSSSVKSQNPCKGEKYEIFSQNRFSVIRVMLQRGEGLDRP